ncbi:MAG TPA: methionine synthase [Capsulimonadaceae bacterium]|jgi:5-methyltetrahydrofolate--homocysteine methyltransferase
MKADFLQALRERVLFFDGAMGTSIFAQQEEGRLTADDFGGHPDSTEILVVTKPSAIAEIHASYLEVGCDAVETDSFNGVPFQMAENGLAERSYELNFEAARLAKSVCADYSTPDKPRFVIGSMGPGSKQVTLGDISFDDMRAGYELQARALIDGGADVLLVETAFDLLQIKCALIACTDAMKAAGKRVPLMGQVTIFDTGAMFLGTEPIAAITALEALPVDVLGINCAQGPDGLLEHVRTFSRHSSKFLSLLPNAGMPELRDGRSYFPMGAEPFAQWQERFVREFGVNIVGGCCGTTPAHMKAMIDLIGTRAPSPRQIEHIPSASSLFYNIPYEQENSVFIIGERTNATGSRKFRDLLLEGDIDGMAKMAREQVKEGANILDLSVDYVGRDRVEDVKPVAARFGQLGIIPIMVDSDSADERVYEEALKRLPGKCLVNSINFEDGGVKIAKVLPVCKRYGAGVVALTIEETGQPHDVEGKIRVAKRLYDCAVGEYGINPEDIFFDTLTFPLSTGEEEYRKDGIATIEAIRRIKAELPGARTVLGVSNCSFGLAPAARVVLNSVFLHYAVEAGLDAAIINAAKIIPLSRIPAEQAEAARRLVFDERSDGYDPLQVLMGFFEGEAGKIKKANAAAGLSALPVEERLKRYIIDGEKVGLEATLEEALKTYPALEIVNTYLLDGMKVVGELFGSGQMQLPFVLQSAEVMKKSVAYLEPHMEKADTGAKGTIVLATVKGDVHDIGKNLVDIILTNNGYTTENIGIKQPIQNVLDAVKRVNADAIGLSGLLVKSTVVMREDLEFLNEAGQSHIPVLLGGAALTRKYVEQDLTKVYDGKVFYAADAFDGLHLMDKIMGLGGSVADKPAEPEAVVPEDDAEVDAEQEKRSNLWNHVDEKAFTFIAEPTVARDAAIPTPPFWGSKVATDIDLRDVYPYINKNMLFRGHWQFRRGVRTPDEYAEFTAREVVPIFEAWKERAIREQVMAAKVVYGYYPANSEGNDLIIYRPEDHDTEWLRFHFPRQIDDPKHLCLADYIAPVSSGKRDVAAFHLVTVGRKASLLEKQLLDSGEYRDYLYLHGLSVETAEALAEYWHKRVREELGIAGKDNADVSKLFAHGYQGSRYSFGYPACPNLEDQTKLFELLDPSRIDVDLSDEFMMEPEQSTSAIILHHPEAKYFGFR